MHTETMWYHTDHAYAEDGSEAALNDDTQYPQYEMSQLLMHGGGGLALVLGDRDDRFLGTFRLYYLGDSPQKNPADVTNEQFVQPEHVVAAYREDMRHLGMGMVGLSWGFIDLGDTMRLGVTAHLGSGFLTNDHTEFLALDVGPTWTWRTSRTTQVYADIPWQMRWRKGASNSVNVFGGFRYMFD
jgi:hypothetical protein